MKNIRDARIERIIDTMEKLSLDELSEALDECGCEEIAEVADVLNKLSGSTIERFERIVVNLANYSTRVDDLVLVYEGNREVVRVVSGSLDELAIVVVVGNEECEFEKGVDGWYEINDAQSRYTFEKIS